MKFNYSAVLGLVLTGALSASAGSTTYSGSSLSGLLYVGDSGDAQYVSGTPDYAQLYTPDSSPAGDSPAVFITGPLGTISDFLGSTSLATGSTVDPYWTLWASSPTDPGNDIEIYAFAGLSVSGSTQVHAYTPGFAASLGTFGETLSSLESMTYDGSTIGNFTIDFAGLEIGDGGTGPATANIDSITITDSVPDGASTLMLLAGGWVVLAGLRARLRNQ